MDIRNYFKEQHPMPGLLGVEKLAAIYAGFTLLLAALYYNDLEGAELLSIIGGRLAIAAATCLLYLLYRRYPCHATCHLRVALQVLLLAYWYPDIYHFASMLPNQDHLLAAADQSIFGCQPALEFSKAFSSNFWRETMYMGYFSYFAMIAAIMLVVIVKRPRRFDRVTFVVMCTFFLYYFVFLFFNTAGPQFYFTHPDVDAANGVFPAVDDWFRTHASLETAVNGPFSYLISVIHGSEVPIAAMPSSHVGASTVILLLLFRMKKRWGWIMLPFYVLLCLSTVYIQAHYAVDVIGGWITALIFMFIAKKLYKTKFFHRPDGFDSLHRFGHHKTHRHHHRKRR